MTTAKKNLANALPPKDFLVKDYELKIGYLTQHFGRMWMRFNYFVGIESALAAQQAHAPDHRKRACGSLGPLARGGR